jgi:hypothetical protein
VIQCQNLAVATPTSRARRPTAPGHLKLNCRLEEEAPPSPLPTKWFWEQECHWKPSPLTLKGAQADYMLPAVGGLSVKTVSKQNGILPSPRSCKKNRIEVWCIVGWVRSPPHRRPWHLLGALFFHRQRVKETTSSHRILSQRPILELKIPLRAFRSELSIRQPTITV